MKAVAITATRKAELIDWPQDEKTLGPDEVAGRTLVTLISPGTEMNAFFIAENRTKPTVGGYAAVFEVETVGKEVRDVVKGDIVFAMRPHQSQQRARRQDVVPVPQGLAPVVAVFCRLMGVSWTTLVTTQARPAAEVLVTGLGPVGNLAAQIFLSAGYRVTAVDPAPARRELAQAVGLTSVRPTVFDEGQTSSERFALVVECSGHEQAVLDGCRAVRKGGEVVMVGVPWRKRTDIAAFDVLHAVFHRYVILRSGWEWELPVQTQTFRPGSVMDSFAAALEALQRGRVTPRGLYDTRSPADCQAIWDDLAAQRGPLTVVYDWTRV